MKSVTQQPARYQQTRDDVVALTMVAGTLMSTRVHVKSLDITRPGVSKAPELHTPLLRLPLHVLFEGGSAFEGNHGLIDTDVATRVVLRTE